MTTGYIEKSYDATDEDMKKINSFTRREFDKDSLYTFDVVLCDNDIDRDYEKFSLGALNQLKTLFVGKTGISDHSMKSSDQRARIFDTWVEKIDGKKTADGEDYYCLKAKAYMVKNDANEQFITEIDAGIKKEVSISCSSSKSTCSICGGDRRKDRCEHILGKEYKGKKACSVLDDITDAYEFSFVAVPAQRGAGVTKAFDLCGFNSADEIVNTFKNMKDDTVLTKSQADKILDYINELQDEAQLGREYRKSLCDEVVRLCATNMPSMDIKTFSGIAQVMTSKELLSFKKAFSQSNREKTANLQIKSEDKANNSVNQYKL